MVAQHAKPPPAAPASHLGTGWSPGCSTSNSASSLKIWRKQQRLAQSLRIYVNLCGRHRRISWLWASDQPSSGYCGHLRNKPADRRSFCPLSLLSSITAFQINTIKSLFFESLSQMKKLQNECLNGILYSNCSYKGKMLYFNKLS